MTPNKFPSGEFSRVPTYDHVIQAQPAGRVLDAVAGVGVDPNSKWKLLCLWNFFYQFFENLINSPFWVNKR